MALSFSIDGERKLLLLMLEAGHADPRFSISLKRNYSQERRPITPSNGIPTLGLHGDTRTHNRSHRGRKHSQRTRKENCRWESSRNTDRY